MEKVFASLACVATFVCLFGVNVMPSYASVIAQPIRTPADYYNAVVNKPSAPIYYGSTTAPPAQGTEPAPAPTPAAPEYTNPAQMPVRTPADYYNAVVNKPSTPVYYGNTPAQAPEPAPAPAPEPAPAPAPPPPQAPSGLTASESRLFESINSARLNEGRPPVEIDLKIVEVARLKARDMIDNNYFGHTSPTYGSPGQMLRTFGIGYRSAGENLAKAGDVYKAHMLILNSTKGHREILLNPAYTKVGVAVVPHGSYVVVVELFVQP